jgi:hypothetical protein
MAYLGRRGALAPLTSADIPAGIVEGTDVAFLENASGTQNLSGTYSTERMYLNDSYTLTGNVTVNNHLALGSIADEDIVITNDGTERTITGSGTLEAGNVFQDTHGTDLTGRTGELGSVVTGSPNLNLGNATFPAGCVIQTKQLNYRSVASFTANAPSNSSTYGDNQSGYDLTYFDTTITPHSATSKILVMIMIIVGMKAPSYNIMRLKRGTGGVTPNFTGTASWSSGDTPAGWHNDRTGLSSQMSSGAQPFVMGSEEGDTWNTRMINFTYLDSPETTLEVKYRVNFHMNHADSNKTVFINKTHYNTNDYGSTGGISTITLMEVAG